MKEQYTIHELMTLFADGELSETEEQYLFDAIASNAELQSEFKQTLLVHKLLNEIPAAIPSEECDAQLFARAGFGEKKKRRGLLFFLHTRTLSAAAAIICVLGTYVWFNYFNQTDIIVENTTLGTGQKTIMGSSAVQYTAPQISGNSAKTDIIESADDAKYIRHRVMKTPLVRIVNNNEEIQHEIASYNDKNQNDSQPINTVTIDPKSLETVLLHSENGVNKNNYIHSSEEGLNTTHPHTRQYSPRFTSHYFVEARGAMSMNANSPNVAFAGMMKLQEKTWIGLAAGRDNMVNMANNSSSGNNDVFEFSTNKGAVRETEPIQETIPIIQHWLGAVIERRLGNIVDGIEPTTRLTIGGAESGPFGKLGIGVMMRFSPQFVGTLGIENTGLLYRSSIDNSWKSVTTFGGLCSFAIEF